MLTLFIRTLLVYIFMFVVLRLMGKRQLSDMQPFDLAITLLIAETLRRFRCPIPRFRCCTELFDHCNVCAAIA